MKQLIKNITIQIYKVLTYLIPVNKKMIIFQSSNGRNYTGNPRYIYEEMVREGLDQEYECIWFFFDTSIDYILETTNERKPYPRANSKP